MVMTPKASFASRVQRVAPVRCALVTLASLFAGELVDAADEPLLFDVERATLDVERRQSGAKDQRKVRVQRAYAYADREKVFGTHEAALRLVAVDVTLNGLYAGYDLSDRRSLRTRAIGNARRSRCGAPG